MSGDLENFILSTIERWWVGRYSERHGLVTSYDPKKYLAKVTFQPEGQESGWLPIETGHIGQGYGISVGLQPGSGGASQPGQSSSQNNHGDQVIVRFQEGDFESGKIVQRVHSDNDTPPETNSGEMVFWTKFKSDSAGDSGAGDNTQDTDGGGSGIGGDAASQGQGGTGQQIYFKNDGSLLITDGNGATIVFDGKGNINLNCKTLTMTMQNDQDVTTGGNNNVTISGDKIVQITGKRKDNVGKNWLAKALPSIWPWLADDDG